MIEQLAAKCQVCGAPMTIGFDTAADGVIDRERYLKFATCDFCMLKMRRLPESHQPKRESNLPYKDD